MRVLHRHRGLTGAHVGGQPQLFGTTEASETLLRFMIRVMDEFCFLLTVVSV